MSSPAHMGGQAGSLGEGREAFRGAGFLRASKQVRRVRSNDRKIWRRGAGRRGASGLRPTAAAGRPSRAGQHRHGRRAELPL